MTHNKEKVISTQGLSASYGLKLVLNNITFDACRGELVCLIGPNGSGKSTLLSVLAGIQKKNLRYTGTVLCEGKDLLARTRREISCYISYMSQNEQSVWNFTVEECILAGRFTHTPWPTRYNKEDKDIVNEAMHELSISHLAKRSIHTLSGGEMQRVRIARSIVQNTPIMLLDEPVANLDVGCQNTILQKLQNLAHSFDKCVILAIHDLNIASCFADRIVLVHSLKNTAASNTQIKSGTPTQMIKASLLSQAYNADIKVFMHPVLSLPQVYVGR